MKSHNALNTKKTSTEKTATLYLKSILITHTGLSEKFAKMTLKARFFIQTILQSDNHSMILNSSI